MSSDLPSGTVTFLFTDVEGSTRLLHSLGAERYAEALAEHRRVIREACASEGGVEVDTQGDAFFFAFPTAPGAIEAAAVLTDRLAEGPTRVRVGLHTGTPLRTDEGYVGADVHRAARIAAAGHGGQVLVSASTAQLVDLELCDLGEHRFKDLGAAERVYQLGDTEFPALKSLYRTNLPIPATPFLGREHELADVGELLARDDVRLLTLTGPGGTGKTRLALQAVAEAYDRYPDGVFWVPLAPLREAPRVLEQAAQTLGASQALAAHVADKRLLLLFDNFEHLVDAAPDVAALLAECPNLDVVVTSRELLQLRAEHAYPVPTLRDDDGLALFLARARAVAPELDVDSSVRKLCERLDNLPLAIELAASRTRHLTPEQLLGRLAERLDLLTGARDADPRQQTLRATIAWSYDLLDAHERQAFARLSVFAGGWTLGAAEDVAEAGLESLASLVDKSLVRRTGDRYWMLETIREFAAEQLERSGETDRVRRRHAEYLLGLARTLGFTIETIEAGATQRHDVAIAEHNNIRAAIDWALGADPVLGLWLATALENFWISYSPFEAGRIFDELVERIDDVPPELKALATRCRGNFAIFTGRRELGLQLYEESLDQYRRLADEHGQAIVEHRLGLNLYRSGERERGLALEASSLARCEKHGFRINEAMIRGSLGEIEYQEGDVEGGLAMMEEALELARKAGFKWMQANLLNALADYRLEQGRAEGAEGNARSALVVARDMGDRRHAVQALGLLAVLAVERGEPERAGRLWGTLEVVEQGGDLGQRPRLAAWNRDRERFAAAVFAEPGPDLERGLRAGRGFSLDDAVEYILASID
jgi:predicted ATPase/class 3 adenylate cyclase